VRTTRTDGTGTAAAPVSTALLHATLDASAEAVLLCSAAGTVLLANAAARALIGAAGTEPFVPAAIGALGVAPLTEAADAGRDTFEGEHEGRTLHGRRRGLDAEHHVWCLRDDTEAKAHTAALAAERARTAFLDEASRRLGATLNEARCSRITAELAVAHLADAAVVVLPPRGRRIECVRLVAGGAPEPFTMGEADIAEVPGLVEALAGFPPIPSRWLDAAQAPQWLLPAADGPAGALLVTPLPGNAVPAGALVLAKWDATAGFRDDDELLTRIFAARAGAAISAAALYREQVDTAAILQADLLPPELPRTDGMELAGAYQPAQDAVRVGGDFYDVFPPAGPAGETVIVLGDVCGKGAGAAVLTGKVRQTLRALRLVERRPEAMLDVLNQALLQPGRRAHRFVTLVVGTVCRIESGRLRLDLASGGHPAPLVLRADGAVEEVPTRGTLIGAVPRTVVQPATVELAPGELCLLFSDGLTEARGGATGQELYGEHRLRAALASCRGMPADAVVERMRQLVSDWVRGGTNDDIAMLAVRAPARTPLTLADPAHGRSQFHVDARRTPGRARHR
jgi:GAF domain-containing protein